MTQFKRKFDQIRPLDEEARGPSSKRPHTIGLPSSFSLDEGASVLTSESYPDMQQQALACYTLTDDLPQSNTNAVVKWCEPGLGKKDTKKIVTKASDLADNTEFKCSRETWVLNTITDSTLCVTDVKGEPVTFEAMNSQLSEKQRKERGPFYYPDQANATHVLYKLRFDVPGWYCLNWVQGGHRSQTTWIQARLKHAQDDTAIGEKKSKKSKTKAVPEIPITARTTNLIHALLPANYDIQYQEDHRMLANVMFVLPDDKRHHDCVFQALTQLRYQCSNSAKWFLTNKNCNILVCSVDFLTMYRECHDLFNEYLLFIPDEGDTIRPVSKVTKHSGSEVKLNTRFGAEVTVPFASLNDDQQAVINFFQLPNINGHAVLSNAAREDSQQLFLKYISRWLLGVEPVMQLGPIFIEIKVNSNDDSHAPIDQTADQIYDVIEQQVPSAMFTREAHYYGSIALVISGPPMLRWLINLKRTKIAEELTRRGLQLLNITQVDAKYLRQALKNDARNKQFANQMFSLMCKMLNTVVSKDCVGNNKVILKPHETRAASETSDMLSTGADNMECTDVPRLVTDTSSTSELRTDGTEQARDSNALDTALIQPRLVLRRRRTFDLDDITEDSTSDVEDYSDDRPTHPHFDFTLRQIHGLTGTERPAKRSLVDAFCRDDDGVDEIRLGRLYSDVPDLVAPDEESAAISSTPSNAGDDLSMLSAPDTLRKKREFILRAGRVRSTPRTSEGSSGVQTKKKPKPNMLARSVKLEKTLLTPSKIHLPATKTDLHLPCIRGKFPDFNTISGETVCKLIDGDFHSIDEYIIVDCRYQYEFEGGHIRGAVNIFEETNLKNYFFDTPPVPNKTIVVIFYCEFSSKRGPDTYKKVRSMDRRINWERNGGLNLHYPELYLLEGGYATFYEQYQTYCDGNYTRMNDECIPTGVRHRAAKLHKLTKRTTSFAGYELRTSSSPNKGTQDAETSPLSLTGSYSPPSSSRGEAQKERDNVAPAQQQQIYQDDDDTCIRCGRSGHSATDCYAKVSIDGEYLDITHKTLTSQRQINSLNRYTAIPSVLSSPYSTMTLSHTGLSLAGIPALDGDEEQQLELLSNLITGVNTRLTAAPTLGKPATPTSKPSSSDHILPTVYEDDSNTAIQLDVI